MKIEKLIEILERKYQSFLNQKVDWHFFIQLGDYMDFVKKHPILKIYLQKLQNAKEKEIKNLENMDKKAIDELKELRKKILKFFENKPKSKKLEELLKKLKIYKEKFKNKLVPFNHLEWEVEIREVIKVLWNEGYKDFVREIIREAESKIFLKGRDSLSDEDIINGFYELSESGWRVTWLKLYEFREKKYTELWGAYEKLYLLWIILFHRHERKYKNEFIKWLKEEWRIQNKNEGEEIFTDLIHEMWTIERNGAEYDPKTGNYVPLPTFSSSTDLRIKEFKRDRYQLYAERLHNYLIQELNQKLGFEKELEKRGGKFKKPVFTEDGVLRFVEREIKFSIDTNPYYLLKTLFKQPFKIWNYDEIAEDWGYQEYEKLDWKKFYNAGYFTNLKIAKETGIKDFLIITSKTININQKYLKS